MSRPDRARVIRALVQALRALLGSPRRGDPADWVELELLVEAIEGDLGTHVHPDALLAAAHAARDVEVDRGRLRLAPPRPAQGHRGRVPDILYHATTRNRLERIREQGALRIGRQRDVYLSTSEPQAWRVAHRLDDGPPHVLYIDAARARRRGIRFHRNRRNGLYVASSVPVSVILNLQDNFAEQLSAGGIPVRSHPDGRIELALIQVTRRSGITWEVAKGKLEEGEVPERTAIREVQEEMGVECDLRITRHLGDIRYGFVAPGSLPRLKTVFLYLMEPTGPMESFSPSEREGIGQVRWFSPDDACRAVTHSSLVPLMYHARRVLTETPPRRD